MMKVLVVGSGGREHTLVWKIAQSPSVTQIFAAPGNAGIAGQARCVDIDVLDIPALADFAQREGIDLTVVGPEAPLVAGIVDEFQNRGLPIYGPTRQAAMVEGSKVFAKELMLKYGIPTGQCQIFDDPERALDYVRSIEPPIVVKADGLAAGKGVVVAPTQEDGQAAVRAAMIEKVFGSAGERVIIEEFLSGQEVSIKAFSDGETVVPMEPAQDYKRVFDGDEGPNTGGMGCYSPVPIITSDLAEEAMTKVLKPTVAAMKAEGHVYRGVLYAGLILTDDGLKTLEFNCRFGDPESQVVLPRLETDLVDIMEASLQGKLSQTQVNWSDQRAVCVVMACGGYPGHYETGKPIQGLDGVEQDPKVMVFHAGTKAQDNQVVTSGGRVLGVTGLGVTFREAVDRTYQAVDQIQFEGRHFRTDIAKRVLE